MSFKFPWWGKIWKTCSKENCNIANNPIPQGSSIWFGRAQFIRLKRSNYGWDRTFRAKLGILWHANMWKTITYLILPICSYFSPKLCAAKTIISSHFRGRIYGYWWDIGNSTVIHKFATPNLDQMAIGRYADGPIFLFGFSPACTPVAMGYALTGVIPGRIRDIGWGAQSGIHSHEAFIRRKLRWQKVWKGQGYATAMYGKWHLVTTSLISYHFKMAWWDYVGLALQQRLMILQKWPELSLWMEWEMIRWTQSRSDQIDQAIHSKSDLTFIEKKFGKKPFSSTFPFCVAPMCTFPGSDFQGKSGAGTLWDCDRGKWLGCGWDFGTYLKANGLSEKLRWFWFTSGQWTFGFIKGDRRARTGLFSRLGQRAALGRWTARASDCLVAPRTIASKRSVRKMNLGLLRKILYDCINFWLEKQFSHRNRIVDGSGSPWKS